MQLVHFRSVLVATDLGEDSDHVVRAAAAIASLTGAALHLLHVQEDMEGPYSRWLTGSGDDPAAILEAERDLERQVRRAIPAQLSSVVRSVAAGVSPSEVIRKHADAVSADLIVFGPHRGPEDRPFLGTTADRVLRGARVPCLVVRQPASFPLRRIGAFVDLSPVAQAGLETALAWSSAFSGGATANAAPEPPPKVFVATILTSPARHGRQALEEARIRPELLGFIGRAAARVGIPEGTQSIPEVLWARDEGNAARAWIRERSLDLVVMGTQGLSPQSSGHLGRFASTMARTAPCSVLLVPSGYRPSSGGPEMLACGSPREVVTAVDFAESSSEGAQWAMRHFAPDANHHLVHVLDFPAIPLPLRALASTCEQVRLAAQSGAFRRLEEVRDLAGRPNVGIHVREGKPADEIVGIATELGADLIVVGEQGPRRGVGALLGSTAERVLFTSPTPVLLARKVGVSPPSRLLVAIDDSEVSGRVLAWTGALLKRFAASVMVLNVIDRVLLADELSGLPSVEDLRELEQQATEETRRWLDAKVYQAGLLGPGVETLVAAGDPSYEIIARAARAEADLVLIGSEGGSVARTPLIGRVVNKVVRSASCSVLVVTSASDSSEAGRYR